MTSYTDHIAEILNFNGHPVARAEIEAILSIVQEDLEEENVLIGLLTV